MTNNKYVLWNGEYLYGDYDAIEAIESRREAEQIAEDDDYGDWEIIELPMVNTDTERKSKDDVYRERNLNALGFIKAYVRLYNSVFGQNPPHGWWPDDEMDYVVIWVDTAEGQMGWHVPPDFGLPDWLPKRDPEYDGYTTEEKYQRMEDFIYGKK